MSTAAMVPSGYTRNNRGGGGVIPVSKNAGGCKGARQVH
jgi:hypothetical protein